MLRHLDTQALKHPTSIRRGRCSCSYHPLNTPLLEAPTTSPLRVCSLWSPSALYHSVAHYFQITDSCCYWHSHNFCSPQKELRSLKKKKYSLQYSNRSKMRRVFPILSPCVRAQEETPGIGCPLLLRKQLNTGALANCVITKCLHSLISQWLQLCCNKSQATWEQCCTSASLQTQHNAAGTGWALGSTKVSNWSWSLIFQEVACQQLGRESFHGNMALLRKALSEGCISGCNRGIQVSAPLEENEFPLTGMWESWVQGSCLSQGFQIPQEEFPQSFV